MIAEFLNQRVTLMRLTTVSGNKKALQTVQTALAQIQNVDTREGRVSQGITSKTYMAWFDEGVTVYEGMILRDHLTGRRYKVIGVEHQGQGLGLEAEHVEVTMVKYNV